ncbi:MAG: RNA polymerase sigma factor RpoD/SigA [Spirochaetia bacterium]|jgi:RNA polymerase primary sigma factor
MRGYNKRTREAAEGVLSAYFKEINKIPLLSRSEEITLARRARRGDQIAREKVVQANLRFVVSIAKGFSALGLPFEDLVSEGNIGLMTALEHFDPERGYRFISYAVWWIRQAVLRAVNEKARMIRLPQNKTQELLQIVKVREDLQGEHSLKSETEAIARKLNSDHDRVARLLNISRELLSLEAPSSSSENDFSPLEDFIEDKRSSQPVEALIESSLREDINNVLSSLSQRESEILQCRFGLNGKGPMTLRAIGSKCKLTKERVRQIEKKAIMHLRRSSYSNPLRAYQ